jgi:hypothetical protein
MVNLDTLILPQVNSDSGSYFWMRQRRAIPMTEWFWRSMGQDGIVVTPLSFHTICAYLRLPPYSPELNPVENIGMSYGRNHSITVHQQLDTLQNH